MPRHTAFHRIVGQETARIIGAEPDSEVRHDWPTLWHGKRGLAILSLVAVEPPVWQVYSYVPTPDEQGQHPITAYRYTYDGHIISVVSTEATRMEMANGTSAARLDELRESDSIIPLPADFLRLATLLQQAPAIGTNPRDVVVG